MNLLADILEGLENNHSSWEQAYERECAALRARQLAEIAEHIPLLTAYLGQLDCHDDMHSVRSGLKRVWLMELGELDYYSVVGGDLRRVLYIGDDGQFYVFGPTDFDSRQSGGLFSSYDGRDGRAIKLSLDRLAVTPQTDPSLVSLVREQVVAAFI